MNKKNKVFLKDNFIKSYEEIIENSLKNSLRILWYKDNFQNKKNYYFILWKSISKLNVISNMILSWYNENIIFNDLKDTINLSTVSLLPYTNIINKFIENYELIKNSSDEIKNFENELNEIEKKLIKKIGIKENNKNEINIFLSQIKDLFIILYKFRLIKFEYYYWINELKELDIEKIFKEYYLFWENYLDLISVASRVNRIVESFKKISFEQIITNKDKEWIKKIIDDIFDIIIILFLISNRKEYKEKIL